MFHETKDIHHLNIIYFIVLILNLCKNNYPLALKRHRRHTISYFYNTDLETTHKYEYLHKALYCTNFYDFSKNINTEIYRCNKTEVTIQESYKENKSRWKSSRRDYCAPQPLFQKNIYIKSKSWNLNTKRYALTSFLSEAWISAQVPFYYIAVWSGLNKLMFSRHGALEFRSVPNKK